MRLGRRYGLSAAQKTEIWRRWKAGESAMHQEIASASRLRFTIYHAIPTVR
jgi:hypothetical protein